MNVHRCVLTSLLCFAHVAELLLNVQVVDCLASIWFNQNVLLNLNKNGITHVFRSSPGVKTGLHAVFESCIVIDRSQTRTCKLTRLPERPFHSQAVGTHEQQHTSTLESCPSHTHSPSSDAKQRKHFCTDNENLGSTTLYEKHHK